MELTDEALDYPDCRPLGRETGIPGPKWMQDLVDARKAKAGKAASPSGKLPKEAAE